MYYLEKWSYSVVPNIDKLSWENPITQIIYVWLCKFANESWVCYPSIKKLSEKCWCWLTSIREYLKRLEDIWIIEKRMGIWTTE